MNVRANLIFSAAIFGISALVLGVGSFPAVAAPQSTQTVAYGFGGSCPPTNWKHPEVKPAKAMFDLACEDGIRTIRWAHWRRTSAFGHGKHLMFNGTSFIPQPATIALSKVRVHDGRHYFSQLVMKWTTKSGHHGHETLDWKHNVAGWIWETPPVH
jgi:hypothetical protein